MPAYESNADRWYQERARRFLNNRQVPSALGFQYLNNPPMYWADWSMCEWGTTGGRQVKGLAEYKRRLVCSDASFLQNSGLMIPAKKFMSAKLMSRTHDITFQYFVELTDGFFMYEELDFPNRGLVIPPSKVVNRRDDPNDQNLVVMLDWDHFHKVADVLELEAYAPIKERKTQNEQDRSEVCGAS